MSLQARVCAHQPEVGPYQVFVGERQICECGDWNGPFTPENCKRWGDDAGAIAELINWSLAHREWIEVTDETMDWLDGIAHQG
jgi:hypothetical protein